MRGAQVRSAARRSTSPPPTSTPRTSRRSTLAQPGAEAREIALNYPDNYRARAVPQPAPLHRGPRRRCDRRVPLRPRGGGERPRRRNPGPRAGGHDGVLAARDRPGERAGTRRVGGLLRGAPEGRPGAPGPRDGRAQRGARGAGGARPSRAAPAGRGERRRRRQREPAPSRRGSRRMPGSSLRRLRGPRTRLRPTSTPSWSRRSAHVRRRPRSASRVASLEASARVARASAPPAGRDQRRLRLRLAQRHDRPAPEGMEGHLERRRRSSRSRRSTAGGRPRRPPRPAPRPRRCATSSRTWSATSASRSRAACSTSARPGRLSGSRARNVEAARESVRVAQDRYHEGVIPSSELLDAETARLLRAASTRPPRSPTCTGPRRTSSARWGARR